MNLKQKRQAWRDFLSCNQLGENILESEQKHLQAFLQNFVGYNFLQISPLDADLLFVAPKVKNTYFIADEYASNLKSNTIVCKASQLPLANESIDLVFLHHFLEWQESPHSVLKEAARVLHPKGYLLLSLFRPMSLWRFNSLYKQTVEFSITQARLGDWLEFLDLEIVSHKNIFSQFLTNNRGVINFSKKLDAKLEKLGIGIFGTTSLVWAQKKIGCPKVERKLEESKVWDKALGFTKVKSELEKTHHKN